MNYRIEKKMSLYMRVFFSVMILTVFSLITKGVSSLIMYGISSRDIAMIFIFILCFTPSMLLMYYIFHCSTSKLIIENNVLIAKIIFRKPVKIPLESITEIGTSGSVSANKFFYVVKYKDKKLHLIHVFFDFFGRDLDNFVSELQCRVDIAKKEVEVNKNSINE